MENFKCGYVWLIGKTNVGKSSFLNALLHEKVSITSHKRETTRNKIIGIKNIPEAQVIFCDTPGIGIPRTLLNKGMQKIHQSGFREADLLVFFVDAHKPLGDEEIRVLKKLTNIPHIIAINKIDLIAKNEILLKIDEIRKHTTNEIIIPISVTRNDGLESVLTEIVERLPRGTKIYDEDITTSQTERFFVSEIIREKILAFTHQEIPYGVCVIVDQFNEDTVKNFIKIYVTIYTEKESHKKIIIGHGGSMLKQIGIAARRDIESSLNVKLYLDLHVKVRKNWTEDHGSLKEFGY
jgi:GTP-binding protein Era